MAAIDSTIGGALGNMQGSCLPFAFKTISTPSISTVFWSTPIVDTGLKATRKYMFSPVDMPPNVPPALFV